MNEWFQLSCALCCVFLYISYNNNLVTPRTLHIQIGYSLAQRYNNGGLAAQRKQINYIQNYIHYTPHAPFLKKMAKWSIGDISYLHFSFLLLHLCPYSTRLQVVHIVRLPMTEGASMVLEASSVPWCIFSAGWCGLVTFL